MTPAAAARPLTAPRPRWVVRDGAADPGPDATAALEAALNLPELLCKLLVARGYADVDAAKRFLRPRLERLGDPFGLADMTVAVERIARALDDGETILVHGDYDVDGISSTALYTRVLRTLGGTAVPFVPDRLADGYDLSDAGIRAAAEADASLILTADCGIVAHEAVDAAAAAGLDVIITDHHTPGDALPAAAAVVNPNRPDCRYPHKGLAGAGVAFKVCQALAARRGVEPEAVLHHLDLVALATIADVAPLTGENRILARYGLKMLRQTRNAGLRALLRTAGLAEWETLEASDVSHVLAPRINAVGRIGEARAGMELLLAGPDDDAEPLAQRLERENHARRELDRDILGQALERLERDYDPERDFGVVLAGSDWHPGVIGIVASRVAERLHRPTVMIALDGNGGPARGSARSIRGFDLFGALRDCSEYFERFGGHAQAAGMDIHHDRIDAFREAFNARARQAFARDTFVPEMRVDLEIGLEEANDDFMRYLSHFGPFGQGNPSPVLLARGVTVESRPREVGSGHLKLILGQHGARMDAIGFGLAERLNDEAALRQGGRIDIVFQLQWNRWKGRVRKQAKLSDLRSAR